MATDAKMPVLIEEEGDDAQQGVAPLLDLDSIFGEPIGAVNTSTTSTGNTRSPVFPVTGLTAEQEKYAAGGAGAIMGPGLQRLAMKAFPGREVREAAGANALQQQSRIAQLLRNLEEEELLRRGIDPQSLRPSSPQPPTNATSGTKWAKNWAGMDREIQGGVPEAAAAYNRTKGQGKVTGKITKKFGPNALQPGGLSISNPKYDPAALAAAEASDFLSRAAVAEAQGEAGRAAKAKLAAATPGPLSQMGNALKSPLVQGPLAGGFAGLSFYEAYQRWMAGDRTGAVIEALGGVGGLMSLVPGLQIPGLAISAASIPAQYLNDRYKAKPETAEQPAAAVAQ